MGISILHGKIRCPELRQDYIPRPALVQLLNTNQSKKLITLIAGAGYGKSSILAEWVRGLFPQVKLIWYSLDASDQDVAVFFAYLLKGLREHWPDVGQRLETALNRPLEPNPEQLSLLLLSELEGVNEDQPLLIVLDDFHRLGNAPAINVVIRVILERSAKTVHLAVTSRQPVNFPVARLRADDQILEYTENDLRFTSTEVCQLFHVDVLPAVIQNIVARTEGWIAGLQLIRQSLAYSQSIDLETRFESTQGWLAGIYGYLAEEIFDQQPKEVQEFLLQSSILGTLTPNDCNAIFQRADSAARLDYLVVNGLFTICLDPNERSYRYHHLFADFLRQRLANIHPPAQVQAWHQQAGRYFAGRSQWNEAFNQAVLADDENAAAEIFLQAAQSMRLSGQLGTLQLWLDRFAPKAYENYPYLHAWQGYIWEDQGQHEKARGAFQQALSLADPRGDLRSLYGAWVGLGMVHQRTGNLDASLQAWKKAVEYAEAGKSPQEEITALNGLALVHTYSGQNLQASVIHHRCLELVVQANKPMRALIAQNMGTILVYMGEFVEALQWYEESLKLRREANVALGIANSLNNIGRTQIFLGELASARSCLEQAVSIYTEIKNTLYQSYAFSNLGELAAAENDFSQAEGYYQRSINLKEQQHDYLGLMHTWTYLSELRRRIGDYAGALSYAQRALAPGQVVAGRNEQLNAETALALARLSQGDINQAVELLNPVITAHRDITHNHYGLVRCLWYLAWALYLAGKDGNSALAEALAVAETWQYLSLVTTLARELPQMLVKAMELNCQPVLVKQAMLKLGDGILPELMKSFETGETTARLRFLQCLGELSTEGAWRLLTLASGEKDPQVRETAAQMLARLYHTPPAPLTVTTLGRFILRVGNREVRRKDWKSSLKSQSVFLFLLAQKGIPVLRDQLIELLWPDTDPVKAGHNLNQAILTVRNVLEPYLSPHYLSRYIFSDEETYSLIIPAGSWVDAAAFEEAIKRARQARKQDNPPAAMADYQQAVNLYQGDYLIQKTYQDWSFTPQDKLRQQVLEALEFLSQAYLELGELPRAIDAAIRMIEIDPLYEAGYLWLMRAQYHSGELHAVLQTYRRYIKKCCGELEYPPSRDIESLYRRVRKEIRKLG